MKVDRSVGFQFERIVYLCGHLLEAPEWVQGQCDDWEMLMVGPAETGGVEVLWRCWINSRGLKPAADAALGKP